MGTEKYGVAHQHDNGRDHLIDLYQELQDAVVYIRAEIERRKQFSVPRMLGQLLGEMPAAVWVPGPAILHGECRICALPRDLNRDGRCIGCFSKP